MVNKFNKTGVSSVLEVKTWITSYHEFVLVRYFGFFVQSDGDIENKCMVNLCEIYINFNFSKKRVEKNMKL